MTHDYKSLGLTAGLEIHQQLNTSKLFCECPGILRSDEPSYTIERKLNPVVGETGIIDVAAEYEKSKGKKFIYQVYDDTNCLVELDEEPPHQINQNALKIALQISLLLNCEIFPVAQVMRKTVIDGSNTSGFQRSVMIAHDGFVEVDGSKISIDSVMLEEDSARLIEKNDKETIFRLDRLGIPLVEITTGPHLHTPEQIKFAALKIGEIIRSCDVKRGIGTIRQDLNISMKGSPRVEIKGFQDPKMMIQTIDKEIERQKKCLQEKNCKSEVRNALPDGTTEFLRPMPGGARMYPETDSPLLKISRDLLNEAKKNLPKLASENKSYLDEFGLNEELVKLVLQNKKLEEFKSLTNSTNNYDLIAKALTIFPLEISRSENKTLKEVEEILNIDILGDVLAEVGKKIGSNDLKNVLTKIVQGKTLDQAIKKADIDLSKEIKSLIKEKPGLSSQAYMGLIMAKFKGQVSGKEVMDELKKLLK